MLKKNDELASKLTTAHKSSQRHSSTEFGSMDDSLRRATHTQSIDFEK